MSLKSEIVAGIRKGSRFVLKIFYPLLYNVEKTHAEVGYLSKNIQNSTISTRAKISTPAQIGSCYIGDYSYIAGNSTVTLTTIGKFCSIGPNFMCGFGVHPTNGLSTSPAFYSTNNQSGITFSAENKIVENLPISIGNDVMIGMNVTVLDGVTIGDGAVIGAGAVVSKDIPPYAVAVGSPIKIMRYRFDEATIADLLNIKWWDFDTEKLKDVEAYFYDIPAFIKKYKRAEKEKSTLSS